MAGVVMKHIESLHFAGHRQAHDFIDAAMTPIHMGLIFLRRVLAIHDEHVHTVDELGNMHFRWIRLSTAVRRID